MTAFLLPWIRKPFKWDTIRFYSAVLQKNTPFMTAYQYLLPWIRKPFHKGSTLKWKNLLLWEQIISFESWTPLRQEATRHVSIQYTSTSSTCSSHKKTPKSKTLTLCLCQHHCRCHSCQYRHQHQCLHLYRPAKNKNGSVAVPENVSTHHKGFPHDSTKYLPLLASLFHSHIICLQKPPEK